MENLLNDLSQLMYLFQCNHDDECFQVICPVGPGVVSSLTAAVLSLSLWDFSSLQTGSFKGK